MTEPTPIPEDVERVARAMAGHFGPLFDDLPLNRVARRALARAGDLPPEHTQEDMLDAARAAIAALPTRADDGVLSAFMQTQIMIETVARSRSTCFSEVNERVLANRKVIAALSSQQGEVGRG